MTRFARLLALLLAGGLSSTCGDDGPPECKRPADCIPLGTDTCAKVGGHGRCVLSCAVANGQDSCPLPLECTAKADDGSTYCTSKPR
jgi:hypothetical protein